MTWNMFNQQSIFDAFLPKNSSLRSGDSWGSFSSMWNAPGTATSAPKADTTRYTAMGERIYNDAFGNDYIHGWDGSKQQLDATGQVVRAQTSDTGNAGFFGSTDAFYGSSNTANTGNASAANSNWCPFTGGMGPSGNNDGGNNGNNGGLGW